MTDAQAHPKLVCGLLFVLGVGLTGCTSEKILAPPPQKDGRSLYLEACASCHGADGKGDGPAADTLKHRPTDLTRLAEQHGGELPRDLILDVLTGRRQIAEHGTTEMPVWGHVFSWQSSGATVGAAIYTQRLLNRITQYLESIQVRPGAGR